MMEANATITTNAQDPALDFARADYRWRLLSADRRNWEETERTRALAAAVLRYHAAKLALAEAAGETAS